MLKRLLSIVLTTIIILSAFITFPVSVNAEEMTESTDRSDTYFSTEDDSATSIPTEPSTELESPDEKEPNTEQPSAALIATEAPTENNEDSINTVEIQSKSELASTGASGETYEQSARYVPNYVITGSDTVQPMYNPYTVQMLLDMSDWAYKINDNDTSWTVSAYSKYGYSQFYHIINNGATSIQYSIGESYVDVDGEQVTQQHLMSAANAIVSLKEVDYNGQKKYAIAVAFKGTRFGDFADVWADLRFIANSDGVHKGFAGTATDFYEATKDYYFNIDGGSLSLFDMIQDMKNENSPYCMLVTGHSLGGALANTFVGYNNNVS